MTCNPMPLDGLLQRVEWPAPPGVEAYYTTRAGGISRGAYASFNLGFKTGDAFSNVAENRRRLVTLLPAEPMWLKQVHGSRIITAAEWQPGSEADGIWSERRREVLAILAADCLPLLLAERHGQWVAALHCGWRGLYAGLIAKTLAFLPGHGLEVSAWLGPAICAAHYPVGVELRNKFIVSDPGFSICFTVLNNQWHADLNAIARLQLQAAGVNDIHGGNRCTFHEPETFFSHRREQPTGRHAVLIWLS